MPLATLSPPGLVSLGLARGSPGPACQERVNRVSGWWAGSRPLGGVFTAGWAEGLGMAPSWLGKGKASSGCPFTQ